jgi:ATP-dependent DNA helicase DinG
LIPPGKNYIRLKDPETFGNSLIELLKEYMAFLADADHDIDDDNPFRIEFDIARGKLFAYLEKLSLFIYQHNENYVYWIEREPETLSGDLYLRGQPVNISDIINKEIIKSYDSSIFVSATLAINGDFSFIIKRLGIENHKTLFLQSSFDYKSQVLFYIAKDIADPGKDEYNEQASAIAAEIINTLNGNCLMLFTSYKTLREVRSIIGRLIDFTVYSQDVLAATEAVDRYVNDNNTVLMGTHSFWQGLDLYGDLVRGVIMMKLPFNVPDSPPVEAKMELMAAAGESPFYGYQVPEAVIRFKQGFGRLIRSGTDRGIVAVLDSRVLSKPYGKVFLKSIPECTVVYSLQEMREALLI